MLDGTYEITDQELTQRFNPEDVMLVEKFDPERIITAVYLDKDKQQYNVKRFHIETTTLKSRFLFIKEGKGNLLEAVSTEDEPLLIVQSGKGSQVRKRQIQAGQNGGCDGLESRWRQACGLQQKRYDGVGAKAGRQRTGATVRLDFREGTQMIMMIMISTDHNHHDQSAFACFLPFNLKSAIANLQSFLSPDPDRPVLLKAGGGLSS
jgi:hypothetical protein